MTREDMKVNCTCTHPYTSFGHNSNNTLLRHTQIQTVASLLELKDTFRENKLYPPRLLRRRSRIVRK
jgi:hypothetical protein